MHTSPSNLALAAAAPRSPTRRGFAQAMVVAGLALTVLWLGMVAWGVAMLVNAAI